MLCCIGWVCYAEKTSPQALPYIDTTKSAQQIIGSILKHPMSSKLIDTKGEEIFHVAVMPCFDKKLEATRKVFCNAQRSIRSRAKFLSNSGFFS